MERVVIKTDILIIGGGAAGCEAGIYAKSKDKNIDVLIMDKANIKRSGCLAAGVNAINAYLTKGETPKSYTDYVKKESGGLVCEDLSYTIGERLNEMSHKLESYGLPFMKDENGDYIARGKRSVKINGESIKPILAEAVRKNGVELLEKVTALNYIVKDKKVYGAYGIGLDGKLYVVKSKATICATGGAAGIYRPNNPGAAKHKMWYSPFNTGGGLAMGIRAGAEMTSFEMRFIALRTKDTISPTGTIAQGVGAKQINGLGEDYLNKYPDKTTPMRLYATMMENLEGRGPCYLDTRGISKESLEKLKKAYLNMSPSIVLKWADEEIDISKEPVEIYGSEPYIVGGHGQAGYWIDRDRKTSLDGLYAAGDVAGGSPKKYLTGAMAEGEIAVDKILTNLIKNKTEEIDLEDKIEKIEKVLNRKDGELSVDSLEENLQKIMDEYAGGISAYYRVSEEKLLKAKKLLFNLEKNIERAKTDSIREIIKYIELKDRVLIAKVVIEHLLYRKETRWKCYQERVDYPEIDNENWFKFVNSVYEDGKIKIVEREARVLGDDNGS